MWEYGLFLVIFNLMQLNRYYHCYSFGTTITISGQHEADSTSIKGYVQELISWQALLLLFITGGFTLSRPSYRRSPVGKGSSEGFAV